MTHHHHAPHPLELGQLAQFDDGIETLEPEEQQRRRIMYLQDALKKIESGRSMLKLVGCILIPFIIIPVFWPMLIILYFVFKKNKEYNDGLVDQAFDYWNLPKPNEGA